MVLSMSSIEMNSAAAIPARMTFRRFISTLDPTYAKTKLENVATKQRARNEGSLPPGLIFQPEFLTLAEENELLSFVDTVDFRTIQMHGVTAKRRIKQFGWHYSFGSYQLTPT